MGGIAWLAYSTAKKVNEIQIREIERKYQPYIIITSLIANVDEECVEKEVDDNVEKDKLINRKGQVYIDYITTTNKTKETLMLNFLQNDEDVKKVQCATVIKIKNIGCQVCSYKISEIEVIYNKNMARKLKGENVKRQKIVGENESIELYLGMAYNNVKYALCDVKRINANKLINNQLDFFDTFIGENLLNYRKLIISFSVYNIRDIEYKFEIAVEIENGVVITNTKYLG